MPVRKGPRLELWKAAVVEDKLLPRLQPGEHMTVGQVRQPEMREIFADQFRKWYEQTSEEVTKAVQAAVQAAVAKKGPARKGSTKKGSAKRGAAKKGQAKKGPAEQGTGEQLWNDDDPASTWFVARVEEEGKEKFPRKMWEVVEDEVAALLGLNKVTCKQLRDLIQRYPSWEDALQLLLSSSYRRRRQLQHQQRHQQQLDSEDPDSQQEDEAPTDDTIDDDEEYSYSDIEDDEFDDQHSWFSLATDLPVSPSVEARKVPETDERKALRGANGIWAGGTWPWLDRDVPPGHVLGAYRHYCMFGSTYNKVLETPKPGWKAPASMWRLELESYAASEEELCITNDKGSYSFVCSAWGYGNSTGYANDPHSDPFGNLYAEGQPDEYLGPYIKDKNGDDVTGNCTCAVVSIMGWPYLFMVTTKPVQKGQEFAYDYGHSYWTFVKKAFSDGQREMEAWALKQREKELNKQLEEMKRQTRELQTQMTSGLTTSVQTPSGSVAAATTSIAQGYAGGEVSSPVKPRVPAAAVSGLTSLGAGMQDMQLSKGSSGTNKQQAAGTLNIVLPDQQQTHAEGVGESPAGARELGKAVSAATQDLQASAVGAASAAGTCDEVPDYEDEASSAFPRALLAYRDQPLFATEQQQQRLQQNEAELRKQHLWTKIVNAEGQEQAVRRIDDPDIAELVLQLVRKTELQLSNVLFPNPPGMQWRKVKDRGWWDKRLEQYGHEKHEFARRRPSMFKFSREIWSDKATVELTGKWRKKLEPLAELERWRRPQQRFSGNKRSRDPVHTVVRVERVVVQDPKLVEELQEKQQTLQELLELVQDLELVLQQQCVQLAPQLQQRLTAALRARHMEAGPSAVAPAGAAGVGATGAFKRFKGAPIPGMGGDDSDSDSGGGGYSSDKSEQQEASEANSDDGSQSRGVAAGGRAGPAGTGAYPSAARAPTDPRLARRSSDGEWQPQQQQPAAGYQSRSGGLDVERQQHVSMQPIRPQQQQYSHYAGAQGQQHDLERPGATGHIQYQQQQQYYRSGQYGATGWGPNGDGANGHGNWSSNNGQQQYTNARGQYGYEADSRTWDGRHAATQQRAHQFLGRWHGSQRQRR